MDDKGSVGRAGVVDKVVAILDALEGGPRSLAHLQAAVGLPRATTHRLATTLERHGLVSRDEAGRFALGLRCVGLARAALAANPLTAHARPVLERLRDGTGESVQLYVREGEHRRCVVSLQSPHALQWVVPEGALLPLAVGSAGRLLAGAVPPVGWVESVEEREAGACSVSAAVTDPGGAVVAAVSVSGPVGRLSRRPGARFGAAVVAAAAELGRLLG